MQSAISRLSFCNQLFVIRPSLCRKFHNTVVVLRVASLGLTHLPIHGFKEVRVWVV
jgi:hypothetical protein